MSYEVGAGYVSIYPNTESFADTITNALGDAEKQAAKKSGKTSLSAIDIGLGTFLGNVATKAGTAIVGNLGTAMNRLDTLTNYPKVMQGFGYSAAEAKDSIALIMERLVGLPTTTQEIVQFTQALADSTGDLDLATRGALAFNDAMLASGAPLADQTRAQRIFNRIMGAGTATGQQFDSLMSVIPLQLGMVAESMLGTGATAQDLRQAFIDGEVSTNDFLAAMVKLDEQGLGDSASWNKQAWNMAYTLETALGLIPTRISNALAAIGAEIGRDNIMAPFMAIADGIKEFGNQIVEGIKWVKENFKPELDAIGEAARNLGQAVADYLAPMWQGFKEGLAAVTPFVLAFTEGALKWLTDNGGTIITILAGVLGGIVAFNVVVGVTNGLLGFTGALGSLFRMFAANPLVLFITVLGGVIAALVTWMSTTEEGRAVFEVFSSALGAAWEFIKGVFQAGVDFVVSIFNGELIQKIEEGANNIREGIYTALGNAWNFLVERWNDAVEEIQGAWANFTKGVSDLWDGIKKGAKKAWDGIVKTVSNIVKGFVEGVQNFIKNLQNGIKNIWEGIKSTAKSIWDAIVNTVTAIVGGFVGAITGAVTGLANGLSGIWNGIKSTASNVWNGIKSVASTAWGGIKDTIGNIANNIKDGAGKTWEGMKSAASSAWNGLKDTAGSIWGGISSTIGGWWDTITGKTSSSTTAIQNSINGVHGKTVDLSVKKGNGFDGVVQTVKDAIAKITGKTVDVNLRGVQKGVSGIDVVQSVTSDGMRIRLNPIMAKMARGGIATDAMAALIGEAGDEAVVPLSNRRYVRPFAQAVASEVNTKGSGVTVTGNTFYVRNDQDINRIAYELNSQISRQLGARI